MDAEENCRRGRALPFIDWCKQHQCTGRHSATTLHSGSDAWAGHFNRSCMETKLMSFLRVELSELRHHAASSWARKAPDKRATGHSRKQRCLVHHLHPGCKSLREVHSARLWATSVGCTGLWQMFVAHRSQWPPCLASCKSLSAFRAGVCVV